MKRICLLILTLLVLVMPIWAQGSENFENFNESTDRAKDGEFLGNSNITWKYIQAKSPDSIKLIDRKGIQLRTVATNLPDKYGRLWAFLPDGIGTLYFLCRKEDGSDFDISPNLVCTANEENQSLIYSNIDNTNKVYVCSVAINKSGVVSLELKTVPTAPRTTEPIISNIMWSSPESDQPFLSYMTDEVLTFERKGDSTLNHPVKTVVGGVSLEGVIIVSCPPSLIVQQSGQAGFSNTLTIPAEDGVVMPTIINLKTVAGLAYGYYPGVVAIISDQAESRFIETMVSRLPRTNEPDLILANNPTPLPDENGTITIKDRAARFKDSIAIPPFNEVGLEYDSSFGLELLGDAPWEISLTTEHDNAAYYYNNEWYDVPKIEGKISFTVGAMRGQELPIVLGLNNPTLPVELSHFTAISLPDNRVKISWISQSETQLSGYYIYRSMDNALSNASLISPLILAKNTSYRTEYEYVDDALSESGFYYYWLEVVDVNGVGSFTQPCVCYYDASYSAPEVSVYLDGFYSVYPNPFNPQLSIGYQLESKSWVSLDVYDVKGRRLRRLIDMSQPAGAYTQIWDGKDESGKDLASGIYFLSLNIGNKRYQKKVALMK